MAAYCEGDEPFNLTYFGNRWVDNIIQLYTLVDI